MMSPDHSEPAAHTKEKPFTQKTRRPTISRRGFLFGAAGSMGAWLTSQLSTLLGDSIIRDAISDFTTVPIQGEDLPFEKEISTEPQKKLEEYYRSFFSETEREMLNFYYWTLGAQRLETLSQLFFDDYDQKTSQTPATAKSRQERFYDFHYFVYLPIS